MKNKVRSREVAYLIGIQDNVIKKQIIDEPRLIETEDYFFAGEAMYLYPQSVVYLLGEFGLVDISRFRELTDTLDKLFQHPKGTYSSNDPNLPQLNTTEQEWNDKIVPIIHGNAEVYKLPYGRFLGMVYKEMNVNFAYYAGLYLDKVGMPNANISKLRVITVTKELRIKFEQTMSAIMSRR